MRSRFHLLGILVAALLIAAPVRPALGQPSSGAPWSKEKANAWYKETGWLVGSNYAPQTAVNQLEMWQADTFDPATIDRELGWAQDLGFNTMRVFLHHMLWEQDPQGFLDRIDQYLAIADRRGIRTMFVLFDGVWDPRPRLGKQRPPKPHVHNSGWVQSPGADILGDPSRHDEMEGYVKGVVGRFKDDRRVVIWDIFNEPDNTNRNSYYVLEPENKRELAFGLLRKAYGWARAAGATQPITSAPWHNDFTEADKRSDLDAFMLTQSDIITFHSYTPLDVTQDWVEKLQTFGRPVLCTEYMARPVGSTFERILPYFKQENVGAYNWGFVAGKSNTIYPWDSWRQDYTGEPEVWFHDIFRPDGAPYRADETRLIRSLTGRK